MNKIVKTKIAFTLIELLVVIAIIGVLSALIVVGMSSTTQKATIAKAQVFSNSLRNSLMSNLISEWKFDQVNVPAANQTPDSWSGGNTGTLNGSGGSQNLPQLVTSGCPSGNCLSFDGTDDYVDCGNGTNLNLTDSITLSAWAKYNVRKNYQAVVGKGSPYWIFQRDTLDGFYFRLFDVDSGFSYAYGTGTLSAERWVYLVATWTKGDYLRLYYDGVLAGTSVAVLNKSLSTTAVTVKIGNNLNGDYFNGLIDEVRIFNAAMPTSQIQQNYFSGINKLFAKNQITQSDYQQRLTDLLVNNCARE